MFGRRAPDLWAEMKVDVQKIDQMVDAQDGLEIRMAMGEIRTNVLFESMPHIQHELWLALDRSVKLGDKDTMKKIYKHSGCNLQDLLDILFIADQLAHYNPAVKLENQNFFRVLVEFVEDFQGAQLDQTICENLGRDFQPIERYLLPLARVSQLITGRMNDYVQFASQMKSIKNPRERYERMVDLQCTVKAGLKQILELDQRFEHEDAGTYLLLMSDLGMPFDRLNVPLVDAINDVRFLYNHLQYLIGKLKKSTTTVGHVSSFESVIAMIVERMPERGLLLVVNTRLAELYNERLLALSRLKDASLVDPKKVSDDVLMELMLDRDNTTKSEHKCDQTKLRKEILEKDSLGNRMNKLGLRNFFLAPTIYS